MPQNSFNLNARAALLAAVASAYPVIGYCAPAAQVDFAVGDVTALGPNGQSRTLGKGAQIEQGDTVNTNGGRAQLRFTDGAYVSLQPQSQFRIDQYRFDGKQDGNEKSFFSLLKGGLRTITGLVGRTNKGNYQVSTTVATIGIRGTEYTIQYGQSITGTVGEGEINVCNGAGCLSVTNGESYYVQNQEIKPVLTNKRTDLPPPEPTSPPSHFVDSENVNQNGDPCVLFPATCAVIVPIVGAQSSINVAVIQSSTGFVFPKFIGPTSAVFSNSGVLNSFVDSCFSCTTTTATLQSTKSSGNDGIIAWGLALGVSGGESGWSLADPFHYVAGIPTDIAALGGITATYSLLGATTPTNASTGLPQGRLSSMNMTANFASSTIAGSMTWTGLSIPLSGTFSGSISSGSGGNFNGFGTTSTASGSVNLQGFFAGANAERAGLIYQVNDFIAIGGGSLIGAAALIKK